MCLLYKCNYHLEQLRLNCINYILEYSYKNNI